MSTKAFILAAAIISLAGPALAKTEPVWGSIDEVGLRHRCSLSSDTSGNGPLRERLTCGKRTVSVTTITSSGPWSRVLIDGKPGMGYQLNKGHTVYSSLDTSFIVEWWHDGYQHGDY